jgi:hypothetical protein
MNSEEEVFDASSELTRLEHGLDFGLCERAWFHLSRTLPNFESFGVGPWLISALRSRNGCRVEGCGQQYQFHIQIVKLWRQQIFVTLVARRELDRVLPVLPCSILFRGLDTADGWMVLLTRAAELEGVLVSFPNWADQVAHDWAEYQRLRLRRTVPYSYL